MRREGLVSADPLVEAVARMSLGAVITDLERVVRDVWGEPGIEIEKLSPFGDGHSGFTYLVTFADGRGPFVLRLSPPGARIAGPADVGRQARVMAALRAAGAPCPDIYASSSAPAIDERAFALIEFVEGMGWEEAADSLPHEVLVASAVRTLKRMQAVPIDETGLGAEQPLGPREELGRWAGLLARAPLVREPGEALVRKLAESCPSGRTPVLVHGDYHFGNLLFGPTGEVLAVLDWEIAEIGEPLIDLCGLAVAALRRAYPDEPNPAGILDVPVAEILNQYGEAQHVDWFMALVCFKYAAILGFNHELHRVGKRPDPVYDDLVETTTGLMHQGALILRDGLDAAVAALGSAS